MKYKGMFGTFGKEKKVNEGDLNQLIILCLVIRRKRIYFLMFGGVLVKREVKKIRSMECQEVKGKGKE